MRFNPIKRILYTDKGEVIRKLECPYKVSFSDTVSDSSLPEHLCHICNGEIVDTSCMNDDDLLRLSNKSLHLCLKIDPTQQNIKVVYIQ